MTSKRMLFGRTELLQLARDPELYTACPLFAELAEAAQQGDAAIIALGKKACCGRDWPPMRDVVNAIVERIREQQQIDTEGLDPLRDFLEAKRGYRPKPGVIYYRPVGHEGPIKVIF